jgi:hypothetical protein
LQLNFFRDKVPLSAYLAIVATLTTTVYAVWDSSQIVTLLQKITVATCGTGSQ